jgi:HEAT repeat protein
MTAATLRDMLADSNREIRSAAARACALKADKQFIPDLISLLADREPRVANDAHLSLKTLTDKDFGPAANATDTDKIKAILAWRSWYNMQK